MADDAYARHNALTREFVAKIAGQAKSHSEMMVVVESMILGAMLIATRAHSLSPSATVEMIDMAVQQATERFAAANAGGFDG